MFGAGPFEDSQNLFAHEPLCDRLLEVQCPIALVYGDRDFMSPKAGAELVARLRQMGKRAQSYRLANSGHQLCFDNPQGLSATLIRFFCFPNERTPFPMQRMLSISDLHQSLRSWSMVFDRISCSAYNSMTGTEACLVKSVSGVVRSGELLAIMGPSGCGKTSLLNALSGRLSGEISASGDLFVQGRKVDFSLTTRGYAGFVSQDAASLIENATVRDFLLYCAQMSRRKRASDTELTLLAADLEESCHIDDVLEILRLKTVEHNLIHNLSSGERKRVSIASDALLRSLRANILFLDEPTSGLSAPDAEEMLELLHSMATNLNFLIIMVIHQPSEHLFLTKIDRLLLMSANHDCVYFGKPSGVASYFKSQLNHALSVNCSSDEAMDFLSQEMNVPADYFSATFNKSPDAQQLREEITMLQEVHESKSLSRAVEAVIDADESTPELEWCTFSLSKIMILLRVQILGSLKSPSLFWWPLLIHAIICVVVALLWLQLPETVSYTKDRFLVLFNILNLQGPLTIPMMYLYYNDRKRFWKEMSFGYYSLEVNVAWCLFLLLRTMVFSLVQMSMYFIVGLQLSGDNVLVFFAMLVLISFALMMLGLTLATTAPAPEAGAAGLIAVTYLWYTFTGMAVRPDNIFIGLRWLVPVFPFRGAFEAVTYQEFVGQNYPCDATSNSLDGVVCPLSGDAFLSSEDVYDELGLNFLSVGLWCCGLVLITLIVALRRSFQLQRSSLYSATVVSLKAKPVGQSLPEHPSNTEHPVVSSSSGQLCQPPSPAESLQLANLPSTPLPSPRSPFLVSSLPVLFEQDSKYSSESAGGISLPSLDPLGTSSSEDFFSEDPSQPPPLEVSLRFENISMKILPVEAEAEPKPPRVLFEDVWGSASAGTVTAILGRSGTGKTSLLKLLSARPMFDSHDEHLEISGNIYLNEGQLTLPVTNSEASNLVAFVPCDVIFLECLTVAETFREAAQLQLPANFTDTQRAHRVAMTVADLKLKRTLDKPVSRISGGERRRLAIGINALLVNKPVVLLDEPTTGLSAADAQSLMDLLHTLAQRRKLAILMTIHQPRRSIVMNSIDKLLLLERVTVFFGQPKDAISWTSQQPLRRSLERETGRGSFDVGGSQSSPVLNPAEVLLSWVATVPREELVSMTQSTAKPRNRDARRPSASSNSVFSEVEAKSDLSRLSNPGVEASAAPSRLGSVVKSKLRHRFKRFSLILYNRTHFAVSLYTQFQVLLYHQALAEARNFKGLIALMLQCLILSIFRGVAFYQIAPTTDNVTDILAAMSSSLVFFVFFCNSQIFFYDRNLALVKQDVAAGKYSLSAVFVVEGMVQFSKLALMSLVYSLPMYFLTGFNNSASAFFTFASVHCFGGMIVDSLGLMVLHISGDIQLTTGILSPFINLLTFFNGFNVRSYNIPTYYTWLYDLSFFQYLLQILMLVVFQDQTYSCTSGDSVTTDCPLTGSEVISILGGTNNSTSVAWFILGLTLVLLCLRVIGFGFLFVSIMNGGHWSKLLQCTGGSDDEATPSAPASRKVTQDISKKKGMAAAEPSRHGAQVSVVRSAVYAGVRPEPSKFKSVVRRPDSPMSSPKLRRTPSISVSTHSAFV